MSFVSELSKLVKRLFRAETARIRTNTVCQVVSYDDDTNLVNLQPCIMGIRADDPDSATKQLPPVNNIPCFQFGSGDLWCTTAPQAGSYGLYVVSDRNTNNWILQGGVVAPADSTRFDLSNGFFLPGLVPTVVDGNNGKMPSTIETDRIGLRNRDNDSYVVLTEDDEIELVSKDDTHIKIENENITATNDNGYYKLVSDGDIELNGNTDFAVRYNVLKAQFDQLKSDFDTFVTTIYNTHIHITTATLGASPTPGVIAPTTSTGSASTADMSNAKVDNVLVPGVGG